MNTAEKEIMSKAKARLMDTFRLTEPEAQWFIHKTAMDTQRKKLDVAKDIVEMKSLV